jgi:hypothetical protein
MCASASSSSTYAAVAANVAKALEAVHRVFLGEAARHRLLIRAEDADAEPLRVLSQRLEHGGFAVDADLHEWRKQARR